MLHQIFDDVITEVLSTETKVFLKQIIFLKSFSSVFHAFLTSLCLTDMRHYKVLLFWCFWWLRTVHQVLWFSYFMTIVCQAKNIIQQHIPQNVSGFSSENPEVCMPSIRTASTS